MDSPFGTLRAHAPTQNGRSVASTTRKESEVAAADAAARNPWRALLTKRPKCLTVGEAIHALQRLVVAVSLELYMLKKGEAESHCLRADLIFLGQFRNNFLVFKVYRLPIGQIIFQESCRH